MNHAVCVACGDQYAQLPLLVCYSDRDELRLALSSLAEWYDAMLLPPVRGKSTLPVQKHREQPSPMSDRVGDVRFEIIRTLSSWASLAAETPVEVNLALWEALTHGVPGMVTYLEQYEDFFLSHPDLAEDYVHELVRLADKAQRVAAPHRREGVVIAWHESADCSGGNVWARNGINGKARCAGCDRTETVQWWHEAAPPEPDDLLIDTEVVSYTWLKYGKTITVNTVLSWRFRKQLPPDPERRLGRVATRRSSVDALASRLWETSLSA